VSALGDDLVAYLRGVAPGNRTGAAFRQAVDFGRHLAARLPTSDGQRLSASLDQLVVRTIRIEAVRAQMKFDVSRITLQAGEDVEIEFVNADEMPHNLLITSPGAMETVALKAEAMVQDPAAFSKHFVPESKDVLFWTPLVAPGETIRRRFTAPARPDGLPPRRLLKVGRRKLEVECGPRGDTRCADCPALARWPLRPPSSSPARAPDVRPRLRVRTSCS
jgi:plastocyanin